MFFSKRTHAVRGRVAACLLLALLLIAGSTNARAATERTLRSVEGHRTSSGWVVEMRFAAPLRYMGHTPSAAANDFTIELRALGLGRADGDALAGGQTLQPFAGKQEPPVASIATRASSDGNSLFVDVHLDARSEIKIEQGSDLDRLEILIPVATSANAPKYEAAAAALLETGRQSMRDGKPKHAAQVYTRVLSMNAPAAHPEAQEMLGLARERSGQRAHARAEYERFLERYPDHLHASRVRQRLQAIATSSTTLPTSQTATRRRSSGTRVDVHGSLLSYYSRAQGFLDQGLGDQLYDSSWFTDLFVRTRVRTESLEMAASAAGRTRLDFGNGDIGSDSRLSDLLFEVAQRGGGFWANVGRQRGDAGVTGRFDGARLGYRATDRLEFQVLGGFPLKTYSSDDLNTDRYQVGGAVRLLDAFDLVDVELYGNYQHEADMTVRGAIGAEVRHLRAGRTLVGTIDYDAFFNVVNLATLLGNQQITNAWSVNGLIEYRKSPIVTLGNALIGQQVDSLEELRESYSESEIKQLAKDRSADAMHFSIGSRYVIDERFDVSGSFSASGYGGTDSSGGATPVLGIPDTGYQFGYYVQLGVRSMLMDRDTSTFGLRIYDGYQMNRFVFDATGRYPVFAGLRLNPIIRLEVQRSTDDLLRFVPRIRLDYSWRQISFDLDVAYEFTHGLGSSERPTENGYALAFGVRYEF